MVTLVDTFGLFFRAYHALPKLHGPNGFPTGMLTGFLNSLRALVRQQRSDYLLFALDSPSSWRKELYPAYKAQRPEPPEELLTQIQRAIGWIEEMGFATKQVQGFEADDVIASYAKCARELGERVRIVSYDKDLFQLVGSGVEIFDPVAKRQIDEEEVRRRLGVAPSQVRDYLALVGDRSDNVPGVRGIGPKSACHLLERFGSLEGIYAHLDRVEPKRLAKLLEAGREEAWLSYQLVELRTPPLGGCDLEALKVPSNPFAKIATELVELGMRSFVKRVGLQKPRVLEFELEIVTDPELLDSLLHQIPSQGVVAFDIETDSLDVAKANLVGFSFAWEPGRAYYVPIGHRYLGAPQQLPLERGLSWIGKLFQRALILGHNLKFDLAVLSRLGVLEPSTFADTMILGWLVDPEGNHGLEHLVARHLGYEMTSYKELVGKEASFAQVPVPRAARYAGADALATLLLYRRLLELLHLQGADHLLQEAEEVEFPLIKTLMAMERAGIKIDLDYFRELQEGITRELTSLEEEITRLAQGPINPNSPKQLAHLLFHQLGLPPGKRTKTGYSTDEATLKGLQGAHPIIEPLLRYRSLFKLKSTYIDPLIALARKDPNQRIHTHFVQTGTATGRLASRQPNLQNIPIDDPLGIRSGFIAPANSRLVAIDYSQIELRLLAHFSQDPILLEAFRKGRDIHLETAIHLFGPEEAQQKRAIAKTINFGLIYGMGARRLAQTLGISTKEAKGIIQDYFASFPQVQSYLQELQRRAMELGYVETLLGRRRYFDFANATGAKLAALIREATNTLFQGSTADLIKLAMNRIHDQLEPGERMLLQIHDELIFELPRERARERGERFRQIMEEVYPLGVPIRCSLAIGERWGDLEKY